MDEVGLIFGRRVRSLRLSRKMTQEGLGHLARIDYKHLSAIERGAKTPSFEAIGKLAKALGVESWELFLPDRRLTAHLETEVAGIINDSAEFRPQDVQEFLRALRGAIRKLDRKVSITSPSS